MDIWDTIFNTLQKGVTFLMQYKKILMFIAPPFAVVLIITDFALNGIQKMITYIQQLSYVQINYPDFAQVTTIYFNKINTYIPLNYMFASFISLLALYILCSIIRIIKSFIPTIN